MAVQLIAGRAGSGKTTHCVTQVRAALEADAVQGPRLLVLAPDQTTLQMERMVVGGLTGRVQSRCNVLGFRRLARLVLESAATPARQQLSPLGRQMILRRILSEQRDSFRALRGMDSKPGFLRELSRVVQELFDADIKRAHLDAVIGQADFADRTARLSGELLRLFDAYQQRLGASQLDPGGMLGAALVRLNEARWLHGARLFVDGFATFTRLQLAFLVELAALADSMDIALLMDPQSPALRRDTLPPDPLSIFSPTERTWHDLCMMLAGRGVETRPPLLLQVDTPPRYANAPDIATLERRLFHAPPRDPRTEPPLVTDAAVRLIRAADCRSEVAAAARDIDRLTRRADAPLRYRDIAVVCRSLEGYHDLIAAELRRLRIPHFIDRRRPVGHHPLTRAVRALVSLPHAADFGRDLMALLKTGLTPLSDDDVDVLDLFTRRQGITTHTAWSEDWTMRAAGVPGSRVAMAAAARDALVNCFGAAWQALSNSETRSCKAWAAQLFDWIERLGVGPRLAAWSQQAVGSDKDAPQEHEQVWLDVISLLDELAASMGEEQMDSRTFAETLDAGLGDLTLALVPPTLDQVLVSAVDRGRQPPLKAVYLLGFADGRFPLCPTEQPMLGDDERRWLAGRDVQVGPERRRRLLDERLLAYVAVTRSSARLWISYAAADGQGRVVMPSPYLEHVRNALPHVPLETIDPVAIATNPRDAATTDELTAGVVAELRRASSDAPDVTDVSLSSAAYNIALTRPALRTRLKGMVHSLRRNPPASLEQATVAALYPNCLTSVSRLEAFARCAFKHHAAHGLRLADDDNVSSERLLGDIDHLALESLLNALAADGQTFGSATVERLNALLDEFIKTELPAQLQRAGIDQRRTTMMQKQLRRELGTVMDAYRNWPVQPISVARELAFNDTGDGWPSLPVDLGDGRQAMLRGKIDRIDLVESAPRAGPRRSALPLGFVFDYKRTGSLRKLSLSDVYHGVSLQLVVYLLALQEFGGRLAKGGVMPAGAFLLPLLGSYAPVSHPDDAANESHDKYKPFRPRGMVDFSHVAALEPALAQPGRGRLLYVTRKAEGELGNVNTSDAVEHDVFMAVLAHGKRKIAALAAEWLSGNVAVEPRRVNGVLPCGECPYNGVCRFEVGVHKAVTLPSLSAKEVRDLLLNEPATDASLPK